MQSTYYAGARLSLLVCSTPVRGHVTPLLAVARTLVAAGHDVRFLTGTRYHQAVEATGATWVALPADADFDDRDIDAAFPGRVGRHGVDGVKWDLSHIFLGPAASQLRAVDALIAEKPVDAVLTESMFFGALLLLSRPAARRPPVVNLGIVPLGLRSRDTAPFALGLQPMRGPVGRIRNGLLNWSTERIVFGDLHREAAELARTVAGGELTTHVMNYPALADAIVQFSVREFEYPRSDLTVPVHFVGPVSLADASTTPLPDWWGDLDGGRPVVHVTQGTVANADLDDLVLPTLRALADQDVLVVVSTGGRELPSGSVPANARMAPYLPYDKLFPRLSALVTNGGYGGVHYALANGVPILATGTTEDKAEVAARVAWSGAGLRLKPRSGRAEPRSIRTAVDRLLHEPSFRENARRIGAAIATAPGPSGIEEVLYGLANPINPQENDMNDHATHPDPTVLPGEQLHALGARLKGELILPDDAGWDDARRAWALLSDQHPAAVVLAADEADVAETVRSARSLGLRVAPQGTGHAAGTLPDLHDAILLRTSRLTDVTVEPATSTVRVGAGAVWGDVVTAAAHHDLTAVTGMSSGVGVAGFVLGGGLGWLSRSHGLGSQSLCAIEGVDAWGNHVRADATQHQELLWAARGGNVPLVVTALELRLHRVDQLSAGALMWPIERTREIAHAWREWATSRPDTVTSLVRVLRFPPIPQIPEPLRGRAFVAVEAALQASPDRAAALLAPLRELAPELDSVHPTAPAELGGVHGDPADPTPAYGDSVLLAELTIETVEAFVNAALSPDAAPLVSIEIRHLGGALASGGAAPVGDDVGAAVQGLQGEGLLYTVGVVPEPDALPATRAAAATVIEALAPFASPRVVKTFAERPTDPAALYGEDVERVRSLAQTWDPDGVLLGGHPL